MTLHANKLEVIISKVLGIDISEVNDDTGSGNTDSWDSFNALVIVTEIENQFDVQLTVDESFSFSCVKDIKKILTKHEALS
jgi:acyl carrier protein